jgi:hypothetical protein
MIQRMKIGSDAETYMPVYVKEDDRFKPCIVFGKTGTGKSEWLLNTWQGDSYSPVSRILIDPSGTLSKQAYSVMRGRAKYISIDNPMGINPMMSPYKPYQIADLITETID